MSIFYCDICHRNEDSDEVGYVVLPDGREVCANAVTLEDEQDDEDAAYQRWVDDKSERRAYGENGGDGRDD